MHISQVFCFIFDYCKHHSNPPSKKRHRLLPPQQEVPSRHCPANCSPSALRGKHYLDFYLQISFACSWFLYKWNYVIHIFLSRSIFNPHNIFEICSLLHLHLSVVVLFFFSFAKHVLFYEYTTIYLSTLLLMGSYFQFGIIKNKDVINICIPVLL